MSAKNKGIVDYDDILSHIGQFGPWQQRIHLLLWLTSAAGGLAVVVFSFTAFNLSYRCANPYCDGSDGFLTKDERVFDKPNLCEYYTVGKLHLFVKFVYIY